MPTRASPGPLRPRVETVKTPVRPITDKSDPTGHRPLARRPDTCRLRPCGTCHEGPARRDGRPRFKPGLTVFPDVVATCGLAVAGAERAVRGRVCWIGCTAPSMTTGQAP